jgi:signal peptidase II
VLDQASKAWVVATIPLGVREHTLGLGFHITHTRNSGAAFGLLRDLEWVVGPVLIDATVVLGLLNLVVSVALVVYLLVRGQRLDRLTRAAAVLVLAGAAGNMIDACAWATWSTSSTSRSAASTSPSSTSPTPAS